MKVTRQVALGLFIVSGLYVGVWAYFAPQHWHETFPGFGRSWLPQLGPYNQHLAKDTGAMYLALAVLSVIALRYVRSNPMVQTTGAAWLTFNILHLVYHVQHLHVYDTIDQILNVVLLSAQTIIAAALLVPLTHAPRPAEFRSRPARAPGRTDGTTTTRT
ncbi:hypothetical protein I3F58_06385 [Streptomyces sp. MUM 203J]|uniref:hypothetical protein n=1 Tax=Streptomyces sp. MUM 203J TaxID=2791990 RepID=UPI0035AB96B6|nr:hypothetical protein [Streptomyces sp. MUM 203J]